MASVMLDFVQPDEPDLAKLEIYESESKDGPLTLIETVAGEDIGAFPNYITRWTTQNATSASNWFAIRWVNLGGAYSDFSPTVQGGTETVVAEITRRVQQRDPMVIEEVAFQESQAVVFEFFGDVNLPLAAANPSQLSGLTMLALARVYTTSIVTTSSQASSWTAGLVAMKSDAGAQSKTAGNVKDLMDQASRMLGLNISRIAQMVSADFNGSGFLMWGDIQTWDQSRLIVEVE